MSTLLIIVAACSVLGVAVGFLAGLLGIGGGLLIVPVLSVLLPWLGIIDSEHAMVVAIATSLASIILTSSASARAHHGQQNVPWPVARWVVVGVSLGALCCAFIADDFSAQQLEWIFAVVVAFIAVRMALSAKQQEQHRPLPAGGVLAAASAFLGGLSSLVGIGGGALIVPMLSHFGLPVKRAIGVAAVSGIAIATFATVGYVVSGWSKYQWQSGFVGFVYLPALASIVITSTRMASVGARMAHRLPVATLKRGFAVLLTLITIKMLIF